MLDFFVLSKIEFKSAEFIQKEKIFLAFEEYCTLLG